MRTTMMAKTGLIFALLMLSACNQSSTTSTPAGQQTSASEPAPGSKNEAISAAKDGVAGAVGTVSAELTSSTKGFVQSAAMGDMYEIEASKIALQRARADDVKMFAQMMIDVHMQTSDNLKAALMRTSTGIALPASLDSRHQGLIDDLKGAKSDDFDTRYIAQQQNAHNEALILMRGYAKDGDNPEIKMFAEMTMPKVQMHIDMLKSLDDAHKARQRRAENR